MKASRYNIWTEFSGNVHLLYNARTNALLRLSDQGRKKVEAFLTNPNTNHNATANFESKLIDMGYVLPDDLNEMDALKVTERSYRFGTRSLGLTICTTLACNLRCVYCYQKKTSKPMSKETQSQVIDFVKSHTPGISDLHIVYFGGEPLMALGVINALAGQFERLAREKQFTYSAGIITNGFLLTSNVAKQLASHQVKTLQVTLDGPKVIHDQRRPRADGQGSFTQILDNLLTAVEHIGSISVRVNIDQENIDSVPHLLNELEAAGLRGKVNVYFGIVDALTDACSDYACNCLSKREFSQQLTNLQLLCLEKGFIVDNYPDGSKGCGAISRNAYVIAPDGKLFKCYNQTGVDGLEIGHINGRLDFSKLNRWLGHDLFEYPECRGCTHLPLCLGECPFQAVLNGKPECPAIHYGIEDCLKLELLNNRFHQTLQQNAQGE